MWRPRRDDELTWFPAPHGALPPRPHPFEVQAFAFGLSRALESLYFPMSEVRGRLADGRVYLAVAPSGTALKDLAAHGKNRRDSALRFSHDIAAAWQRIRAEVEEYSAYMASFDGRDVFRLKRVRANQWFAPLRAVVAPAALLLYDGLGQTPRGDALVAVDEVRREVVERGARLFSEGLSRAGVAGEPSRLPDSIGRPDGPEMFLIDEILGLLAGSVLKV
jgi:hypothetical protein